MEAELVDREELLVLLGSVPERLADLIFGLDENRLRYRHGPAFPTLLELITHMSEGGTAVDSMLRAVQIDGLDRVDVRRSIDPPIETGPSSINVEEMLDDFGRVRRRSVDLLRGAGPEAWSRRITDPLTGELTLLDVAELVTRHELGHLTQVRNLIAVLPEPQDLGPPRLEPA